MKVSDVGSPEGSGFEKDLISKASLSIGSSGTLLPCFLVKFS